MIRSLRHLLVGAAALLVAPAISPAVTFTYDYSEDGASEGFNDPTVVGSTTLGAQRKAALEYCGAIWANRLSGSVNIVIHASFDNLGGDGSSAVLGSASAEDSISGFIGQPVASTWYPIALANQLAGSDQNGGTAEIDCQYNSEVDGAVVLGSTDFYYGLDENPTSGDISFVRTCLHEFGHGLGFYSLINSGTGAYSGGLPSIYDRFLQTGTDTNPLTTADNYVNLSNANRLIAITGNNSSAFGPTAITGFSSACPLVHVPATFQPGSSISHYKEAVFSPEQLMEPIINTNRLLLGLTDDLFTDMGWTLQGPTELPDLGITSSVFFNVSESAGPQTVSYALSAASTQDVTFDLSLSGTAVQGTNYSISQTSFTILAGSTTASFTVDPLVDGAGGSKTLVIRASGILKAQFPASNAVTFSINDAAGVEDWKDAEKDATE